MPWPERELAARTRGVQWADCGRSSSRACAYSDPRPLGGGGLVAVGLGHQQRVGQLQHPLLDALEAAATEGAQILVNNAGAIPGGSLEKVDEASWREAWNLKVFGYINLTRAVYANLAASGGGVIVNVIGAAGERQDYNYVAGSTGNAGLMAFTRALGSESAKDNIRVVAINPGMTETERLVTLMRGVAEDKGRDPDDWRSELSGLPFGRPGTAAEVADLVAFLASKRASYISGTVVTIDGGSSARGVHF